MQNNNNIMTKAALVLIAAFFATACVFEKMPMPKNLQSVLIQVNVSADEVQTRATTEAPSAAEAAINSIRIYAYWNGILSGHYYSEHVSTQDPIVMDLKLPDNGTQPVDFYVIANEANMNRTSDTPALTDKTTAAQLETFKFSSFTSNGALPMYHKGTQNINVENISSEISAISGHENHYYLTQEVEIDLYRPFAKVSLYAATDKGAAAGVQIDKVTMKGEGSRLYAYLLPQADATLKTIPIAAAGDISFLSAPLSVTGTTSSYDNYTPVFENQYLLEVPYGVQSWDMVDSNNTSYVKFDVQYTGGSGRINMPPIVRNTHYKIYCTIKTEGSIKVDFIVADWEDTPEWKLDFAHPTYQNPVLKTGNHEYAGGEATMYYTGTEQGAFSVDFKMTAPSGQKWTPTFDGISSDYQIKIYDNNGNEVSAPVTASESFYTIKVVPLKPENIGKTVQFGITYIPTWTTYAEFLQINGNAGSLFWTTAGSNEDLITIRQIEQNN